MHCVWKGKDVFLKGFIDCPLSLLVELMHMLEINFYSVGWTAL
jgi:hypothetical protein